MEAAFCQREWDKTAENLHFLQNAKVMNSGRTLILVAKACQYFLDEMNDWNVLESFSWLKMWSPKVFQLKILSFVFLMIIVTSNNFITSVVLWMVMTCAEGIQMRPGSTENMMYLKYSQFSMLHIIEMAQCNWTLISSQTSISHGV